MSINNKIFKVTVIFIFLCTSQIFAKRVSRNSLVDRYNVVLLKDLIAHGANITIQKCLEKYPFEVAPFPLSEKYPYKGYFKEPFIAFIPEGKVQGYAGVIFFQDYVIKDLFRIDEKTVFAKNFSSKIHKYEGRLAVLEQVASDNYFHWTNEVLGRLALLEMQNIEYDKLYVSMAKPYMKQFLVDIWGINPSKIIASSDSVDFIQADMLIVPSLIDKLMISDNVEHHAGHYTQPIIINYVREKVLSRLQQKINLNNSKFSKRVFISRNDAPGRKILNEDEIFKIFENKGFKRYVLGQMTVIDQIILFHNAEIIVCEHGAGLTNALFCKPKTKIIEIFQELIPIDYWWISRMFDFDYIAINTMGKDAGLFETSMGDQLIKQAMFAKPSIALDQIKK
jgi:hypothetical protein